MKSFSPRTVKIQRPLSYEQKTVRFKYSLQNWYGCSNLHYSTLVLPLLLSFTRSWITAPETRLGGLKLDNIMMGGRCRLSTWGTHPAWTLTGVWLFASLCLIPEDLSCVWPKLPLKPEETAIYCTQTDNPGVIEVIACSCGMVLVRALERWGKCSSCSGLISGFNSQWDSVWLIWSGGGGKK